MMSARLSAQRGVRVAVALLVVTSAITSLSVLALAASEQEPNDSRSEAVSISTGTEITGEVATEDDQDWFKLSVEKGEALKVPISLPSDASGTPFVRLKREVDGELEIVEGGYLKKGETVTFNDIVESDGDYYIQIYFDTGSYSFTPTTTETDPFEPNEGPADAVRIQEGVQQQGEISVTNDNDWFKLPVERGETLEVPVSLPSDASGTPFVRLRKEVDGELEIVQGRYLKKGETVSVGDTIESDGDYYIQVYFDTGSYSFTPARTETDPFEPNEGRSSATATYYNPFQPTQGQISINDYDWFAVEAEAGEELRVEGTSASGDGFVYIKDDEGNLNGTYLRTDGRTATRTVSADGTYYFQVYFDRTQYDVEFSVGGEPVGLPNDRFERGNPPLGNQDRANATDLDAGNYTDLGMVDDDRDVFAVELQSNERVTATINFTHADNDLALELQDAAGQTVVQSDTSTDDERIAVNATGSETHYLIVTGESGAATRYELNLTVTTVGAPESAVGQFDEDGDGAIDQRELLAALAVYDADAPADDPDAVNQRDLLELLAVYDADA